MRRPRLAAMTTARPRWIGPPLLLAFVLCSAFASSVGAQQEPSSTAVPPATSMKPIPIAEIGVIAERAKRELREISQSLASSPSVDAVEAALPEQRRRVDLRLKESESIRDGDPSMLALDQASASWAEIGADVTRSLDLLTKRANQLADILQSLRDRREVWQLTRTSLVESDADRDVTSEIDAVVAAVDSTTALARERQNAVLRLQSDLAKLDEIVREDRNRLQERRRAQMGALLKRDQPPLWSAEFWAGFQISEVDERLLDQQEAKLSSMRHFVSRHRESLAFYGVLSLLFCALMFYLRPTVDKRLGDDADVAKVRAILDGPISLTMTGSFTMAFIWISPENISLAPMLAAAAFFPAIIVLRKVVEPQLFPMMNALIFFFFVGRIRELVAPLYAIPRLIFVVEAFVAIAALAYWLRPSRLVDLPIELARSRVFRVVGIGMRFALAGAVVALFAEIAGYTRFALLVGGTIGMAGYSAVVLYGGVQIVEGLVLFILRTRPLRILGMVQRERPLIQERIGKVVRLAGWFLWATATLWAADLHSTAYDLIAGVLAAPLPLPEVTILLGDVVAAVLTFWAALLLSRFIRFALAEDVYTRVRLPKGRPYAISTLLHYTIMLLGFGLACSALGVDLNRFTLVAGAFGVGIGFGLQNVVNNFVSGLILLTERPVQVGDTVSLGEVFGQVERIGIRSSTVRTWQGAEIILPNGHLVSEQVTNWTLSDRRRRLEVPVGVAYGSDPRQVIEVLLQAASQISEILPDPEPYVLFHKFGDSSLDFELRAWTTDFDRYQQVRSDLHLCICDALAEAGIQIPFPQRDLHVKSVHVEAAQRLSLPAPSRGPSPATRGQAGPTDGDAPE